MYLYSDSWEQLDTLKDAGSGKATFTFTVPKDEGTYYIVGFDPNRKIPTDDSGGTNYAKIAPATAILTVSGTAELERPFQTVSVDGKALDGKNISYEGIVSLGSEDSEEFRNVYEEVSKYHVIVPEGTQTVDITYGKDVDIYHADATAYGYETDLAADAVSSATIRSVTLESSYKANDDGSLVLIQAAIFRVGVFYISSQRLQIVGVAFLRAGQCHGHSKPVADGSACGELLLILQKLSLLPAQGGHSLRALGDFRIQRRLGFRESHCGDQKQYAEQHRYQFRSFFHAAASKIRFISLWQ